MVDEVLQQAADLEQLSFYGLNHWLGEVGKLLDKAAFASTAKNPSREDASILDSKADLEYAQSHIKKAMGEALQKPSLTKRERPLAEDFLKQQAAKLEVAAKSDARAEKPLEKLRKLIDDVRTAPAAAESQAVRKLEAEQKQLDAEWKEVSPIYDKWEAGRQSFKSNDELQKFKRRYEACKRAREALPDKLESALKIKRAANEKPEEPTGPPPGWAAVAKKEPPKDQVRAKAAAMLGRDRFGTKKPPPKQNRWGTGIATFAQQLQASIANSVRAEVEAEREAQDDEAEDDEDEPVQERTLPARPPPPAVPVVPKKPPPLPASVAAPMASAGGFWEDDEEDDDAPAGQPAAAAPQQRKASAKKKGKAKKKKAGGAEDAAEDDDDLDIPAAEPAPTKKNPKVASQPVLGTKPGWIVALQDVVNESLIEDIVIRQGLAAWGTPDDADLRLEEIAGRLPWASPLGLSLPSGWEDFITLEIDGGPRRTSKRGEAPWVVRLQRNMPWLLPYYLTIFFVLGVLNSLSHFGLLFWAFTAQAGLVLAPREVIKAPIRCLALQAAHLLVWAFFVRACWQTHIFVKMFLALLAAGHSYAVAEQATD